MTVNKKEEKDVLAHPFSPICMNSLKKLFVYILLYKTPNFKEVGVFYVC